MMLLLFNERFKRRFKKEKVASKTEQVDFYRHLLSKVDPSEKMAPYQFQELYKATKMNISLQQSLTR